MLTQKVLDAICEQIAEGQSLRKSLSDLKISRQTFYDWIDEDPKRADQYARARERCVETHMEGLVDLADEAMGAETSEEAAAYRLRIDTRKWIASKLKPRKYGDAIKHEHTGADGAPIVLKIHTGVPKDPPPTPDADHG